MNEFEEKDYGSARGYADGIYKNANNILDIFKAVDGIMNNLYSDNWESTGAMEAKGRYDQIRKNYEVFYNIVVAMKTHVYAVTAANEEADAAASNVVSSV